MKWHRGYGVRVLEITHSSQRDLELQGNSGSCQGTNNHFHRRQPISLMYGVTPLQKEDYPYRVQSILSSVSHRHGLIPRFQTQQKPAGAESLDLSRDRRNCTDVGPRQPWAPLEGTAFATPQASTICAEPGPAAAHCLVLQDRVDAPHRCHASQTKQLPGYNTCRYVVHLNSVVPPRSTPMPLVLVASIVQGILSFSSPHPHRFADSRRSAVST
jgi:hypothetical protein